MKIAPDADTSDGKADLVVFREVNRREILAIFKKVFAGTHKSHPKVEILQAVRDLGRKRSPAPADGGRRAPGHDAAAAQGPARRARPSWHETASSNACARSCIWIIRLPGFPGLHLLDLADGSCLPRPPSRAADQVRLPDHPVRLRRPGPGQGPRELRAGPPVHRHHEPRQLLRSLRLLCRVSRHRPAGMEEEKHFRWPLYGAMLRRIGDDPGGPQEQRQGPGEPEAGGRA